MSKYQCKDKTTTTNTTGGLTFGPIIITKLIRLTGFLKLFPFPYLLFCMKDHIDMLFIFDVSALDGSSKLIDKTFLLSNLELIE